MKNIKSVGYAYGFPGEIINDLEWSGDYQEYFDEGETVDFETGLKELKEYVFESLLANNTEERDMWDSIEKMLLDLKEEVGDKGRWVLWGVESDLSLGVKY
jgi:argininosuccinate lyase